MNILFVSQYGQLAASSRTRVFQYLPYLRTRNVEARVLTVLPDAAISGSQIQVTRNPLRKLRYYLWASWRTAVCGLQAWFEAFDVDILFIQKVVFPAPVRWLFRLSRPIIVYDFDDAIFTTELQAGANWLAALKARRNARGLPAMLSLADRAIVENEYNGAFARTYCPTTTITGPVDTGLYGGTSPEGSADRSADGFGNGQVVLGWIGSATTLQYLELIRAPLSRLGKRFPNLRLDVVGAEAPAMNGLPVQSRPWDLEREAEDLRGFDIGLMPMADDAWTRGKGGYKLLQYMASGLPVVTSPVGVNREIVSDGESGFWATDELEWEEKLARLVQDRELRLEMGQRGRAVVQARYALNLHQERLLEMLLSLVCERKRGSGGGDG